MEGDRLREAATGPTGLPVRLAALPEPVVALLVATGAPPRLAAHLRAVHDVACQLVSWLEDRWPQLAFDAEAVRFGAATHDIGKAAHSAELTSPGAKHEIDGYTMLVAAGIPHDRARFARTHGSWDADGTTIEDHLVALADKIWKAQRVEDLEHRIVHHIATASGSQPWEIFLDLDDHLTAIADDADSRLAFQARYSTRPTIDS